MLADAPAALPVMLLMVCFCILLLPAALQALEHRSDNKLYRLQTPQSPITRTQRWVHSAAGVGWAMRPLHWVGCNAGGRWGQGG